MCWVVALWNAFTGREWHLEITQQAKRRCGYPDKWQRTHLEMEQKAYLEESRQAYHANGDDKCTQQRVDGICTYKCTDSEDNQCDCKSTREIRQISSELDTCRMSTIVSSRAVLKKTEKDLRTCQIVYRMPARAKVTEWHRERQLSNVIMRGCWDIYRQRITEYTKQDHGIMTKYWDSTRGLSRALYWRHRLGCLPNSLPQWMLNDHIGGL